MKCGFCGYEFDAAEGDTSCLGCPLRGNCGYARCPRCNYDNPREAALVRLIREWASRWRGTDERPTTNNLSSSAARVVHCRSLAELIPGDEGHIACVQSRDQRAFHKLMAMGVLPGNSIKLLRRSPAYVFQVGFSQFAVDRDIAEKIYVRAGEAPH